MIGSIFFISQIHWFLWEDLGLDLYKQIDEWFSQLEAKQYEYELTGQGETNINEVLSPILEKRWLNCDFASSSDIESALWNQWDDQVKFILERCGYDQDTASVIVAEEAASAMSYVKNTFTQKAVDKSKMTYDIARIGLYNDGNIENSPFDLIHDLKEIDKIIFTQELEYDWVPYEKSADEELDDFLNEDKDYLYEDNEESDEDTDEIWDEQQDEVEVSDVVIPDIFTWSYGHSYVCLPDDETGIDTDELEDIIDEIEDDWYTGEPRVWEYPDDFVATGAWGWPYPGGASLTWSYDSVTDSWGCDPSSFFCVIIEFESSDYGLTGGETVSIEKILAKAAEHLEKPANTSLTQKKMTTNNFEISSMIKNLPDMLRGFWMQVSSKPIPILDLEEKDEQISEGSLSPAEEALSAYYKNQWLDYERKNSLNNFRKIRWGESEEVQKVIQTSAGMPTPYVEARVNELKEFQSSLIENNRKLEKSNEWEIQYNDMKKFSDQFAELERFTASIEDFVEWFTGHVTRLKNIPIWWK